MKNRLRWVDRDSGKAEDVTLYFDGDLPMKDVASGLETLSRSIPRRPARYEIRPLP